MSNKNSDDESVDDIWASMNERRVDSHAVLSRSIQLSPEIPYGISEKTPVLKKHIRPYTGVYDALVALPVSSTTQKLEALSCIEKFVKESKKSQLDTAIANRIVKGVLKCVTDKVERCRAAAIVILVSLLSSLELDVLVNILPLIIPVLKYRLVSNTSEALESSEEIRVQLMSVTNKIVKRGRTMLVPFFDDLLALASVSALDRCPEVIELGCHSLVLLCSVSDRLMHEHSKALVLIVYPLFVHRRANVRIAVIQCVSELMFHGATETIRDLVAFRERNVIPIKSFYEGEHRRNVFASLVADRSVRVRREFYNMMHRWRVELRERLDYETLLMPYVLSSLVDNVSDIQESGLRSIENIGLQYEKENEEELVDRKRFAHDLADEFDSDCLDILPAPFKRRPLLGEMIVVAAQIPRLLPAILEEINDWQSTTRSSALLLLRVLIFYADKTLSRYCFDVAEALLRLFDTTKDSKSSFTLNVIKSCTMLLARFADFALYWPAIEHNFENSQTSSGTLQFLYFSITAMSSRVLKYHARKIVDTVLVDTNRCTSSNAECESWRLSIAKQLRQYHEGSYNEIILPNENRKEQMSDDNNTL